MTFIIDYFNNKIMNKLYSKSLSHNSTQSRIPQNKGGVERLMHLRSHLSLYSFSIAKVIKFYYNKIVVICVFVERL